MHCKSAAKIISKATSWLLTVVEGDSSRSEKCQSRSCDQKITLQRYRAKLSVLCVVRQLKSTDLLLLTIKSRACRRLSPQDRLKFTDGPTVSRIRDIFKYFSRNISWHNELLQDLNTSNYYTRFKFAQLSHILFQLIPSQAMLSQCIFNTFETILTWSCTVQTFLKFFDHLKLSTDSMNVTIEPYQ